MTPTEQYKKLREQIANLFDELCEPTNKFWHRDSGLHWAGKVMELITADRKRVALEARIDELKKVDMLTKPLLPNSGSVETSVKAWVKDRLPQLKAQQEEV